MVPQPQPSDRRRPSGSRWQLWLVLGLFFGLGYGLTQRLLGLRVDGLLPNQPGYGFKEPPGTRLEELRKRSGDTPAAPIRADLDRLERETRARREAAEASRRKAEAEARSREDQQQQEMESLNPPAPAPPAAPDLPPAQEEPASVRETMPPPADVIAPPGSVGADPPPPPIQP